MLMKANIGFELLASEERPWRVAEGAVAKVGVTAGATAERRLGARKDFAGA